MTPLEKLKMMLENKLIIHERMVAYHEAREELVKMTFHEGFVATLTETLKFVNNLLLLL